jgi:hypothetical protein
MYGPFNLPKFALGDFEIFVHFALLRHKEFGYVNYTVWRVFFERGKNEIL